VQMNTDAEGRERDFSFLSLLTEGLSIRFNICSVFFDILGHLHCIEEEYE